MSAFETIKYDKIASIGVITLDRPEVVNAINIRMRDELYEAVSAAIEDDEVHGILLQGSGSRGFCSGADLTEFGTSPSQAIARQVRWERDLWGLILNVPKPMVAAVHGACFGSGLEIACLCDLRVSATNTLFRMPEVRLGLVPAAGGTQILPRVIGSGATLDLLLSGKELNSTQAFALGLVTRLVSVESLRQEAMRLLEMIVNHSDLTLRNLKRLINEGMSLPLDKALDLEYRLATSVVSNAYR
jgi:enoyl-CoA hydratase/carnithine racemase